MTLNKNKLKEDIQKAFDAAKSKSTPEQATPALVAALADAIDAYVRGGEIKQVKVDLQTGDQIGKRNVE
ncbi:MAG: hypothetical protein LC803_22620 [Acidobacteria bacterium]|nr:hypothetical protein [Acidobacteriota bacterium]